MRRPALLAILPMLPLLAAACDEPAPTTSPAASASAAAAKASAKAPASAAPSAAPAASASAEPPKKKGIQAPRPVPLGSSGPIQPSAPPEQQMMAIQYTLAMLAPDPTDPLVDAAAIDGILKKLEGVVRSADKGKTPPNPVSATKGKRKIEIQMGKGCTDRVPSNLLEQRAGVKLKDAYDAGVLVVMCHDDKWECHQSTRDSADVLCLAAPRSH